MADITKIQPMGDSTQYELGARYLTTARTLTIGNTGKTFNGTANVSWTLSEIGAAAASHTHSYLPLSGGTLTGAVHLNNTTDVGLNQNGALVIGPKDGENIGIDNNEIMARNNSSTSTLYLNSEGGNVYIGAGGVTTVGGLTTQDNIIVKYDKQIIFYGKNNNTSPKAQMGYASSITGVMHSVNTANSQTSGAFYIWSNGCDAANDNGGIAIDNEGVTVFGAGDAASNFTGVFRVVNEDDVAGGSIFTVQKGGGIVHKSGARFGESTGHLYLGNSGNQGWVYVQDMGSQTGTGNWNITQAGVGTFKTCKGAVWNDYAEMRNVPEAQNDIEFNINEKGIEESRTYPYAGRCVKEKGNGEMLLSTKRLEYGCKIISDTFGFCIGETDNCKTPIAVTGRVLAYPYEDIEILKQHIGEPVCSGPNGTVSLMTHEEEKEWPSKILGIISEIPNYSIWHCGVEGKESINVNGRIWIYVK